MIGALWKINFRTNRTIILLITAIYSTYSTLLITVFNPKSMSNMNDIIHAKLPNGLVTALGINIGTTLISFMATILFGIMLYILPMIVMVSVNKQLLAGMVEKGSMAFLLATPHRRWKIALNQALFSVVAVSIVFAGLATVDSLFAHFNYPGRLDIGQYWELAGYAAVFYFAMSSVAFVASALANSSSGYYAVGAGVPMVWVLCDMLANSGGSLADFKYATLFTLFDPNKLFAGSDWVPITIGIFVAIAVVLYTVGICLFAKRDLPL